MQQKVKILIEWPFFISTFYRLCLLNVGTAYPVHTLVVPTPTTYQSMT
jgi:hypothetical protein